MTDAEETPWEGLVWGAAGRFSERCRELHDTNPYTDLPDLPPALSHLMVVLATDLWDDHFSQTEIRAAFEAALTALGPYAAGEDRRGDRDRVSP
jgi:hypothetical protein